jgi:hypothetical protein
MMYVTVLSDLVLNFYFYYIDNKFKGTV